VVFHVSESEEGGGAVPQAFAGRVTDSLRCMEGTDRAAPRCVALRGRVGEAVRCVIYAMRPSPCRDFHPHGVLDISNEACSRARARHGLAPLPHQAGLRPTNR
jgi:hypothetical protein